MRRLLLLTVALLALAGCAAAAPTITPDAVTKAFTAAGLAVQNTTTSDVLPEAIASALNTCQGARFDVEGDKGARVVVCSDTKQAEALATYYTELGKSSPMFFSHVERRGNLVLQMNGELPAETFQKYVAALP